jgi:hypothetical protein
MSVDRNVENTRGPVAFAKVIGVAFVMVFVLELLDDLLLAMRRNMRRASSRLRTEEQREDRRLRSAELTFLFRELVRAERGRSRSAGRVPRAVAASLRQSVTAGQFGAG